MKGIIVKQPWADLILSGAKSWEIRSSHANFRGVVGIVSEGQWIGTVEIIDSLEISEREFEQSRDMHRMPAGHQLKYKKTHAWVLFDPIKFDQPKSYSHKKGCVIWVTLD